MASITVTSNKKQGINLCKAEMKISKTSGSQELGRGVFAKITRGNVRVVTAATKKAKAKVAPAVEFTGVAIKEPLSAADIGAIRVEASAQEALAKGGGSAHVAAALAIGIAPKTKKSPNRDPTCIVYDVMACTLEQALARGAAVTEAHVLKLAAGLLQGAADMACLAKRIHGDIKPANVMFGEGDADLSHPFLVDLGEARQIGSETMMTFGTPRYNAPELLAFPAGGVRVTTALDVWAICVGLGELVAGLPGVRAELPGGFGGGMDEADMRGAAARGTLFQRDLRVLRDLAERGLLAPVLVEVLEAGLQCDTRQRASLDKLRDLVARGLQEATAADGAAAVGDERKDTEETAGAADEGVDKAASAGVEAAADEERAHEDGAADVAASEEEEQTAGAEDDAGAAEAQTSPVTLETAGPAGQPPSGAGEDAEEERTPPEESAHAEEPLKGPADSPLNELPRFTLADIGAALGCSEAEESGDEDGEQPQEGVASEPERNEADDQEHMLKVQVPPISTMAAKPQAAADATPSEVSDTQSLQALSARGDSSAYPSPDVSPMRRMPSPVAVTAFSSLHGRHSLTLGAGGSQEDSHNTGSASDQGSTEGDGSGFVEEQLEAGWPASADEDVFEGYIQLKRRDELYFDASDAQMMRKAGKTKRMGRSQKKGRTVVLRIGRM